MSESGKTAFVTGAASGIGRAVVQMLIAKGANVFLADRDLLGAETFAQELNGKEPGKAVADQVDVSNWRQQVDAFDKAIAAFGRIDYVYPIAGIGEKAWLPKDDTTSGWQEPDLSVVASCRQKGTDPLTLIALSQVLDVNLKGVLYTCSLAIQHFRRQEVSSHGFRGKIFCVASMCGFYCVPTLPIYTAAKHGVVGFVRSYGKYLADERITLNAICPNVVRTSISSDDFYEQLESKSLLTPMESLLKVFDELLGSSETSGEIFEVGPKGIHNRAVAQYMDDETQELCELLLERARPLQSVMPTN